MVNKSSKYFKELNGSVALAKMAGSIMTHYYDLEYKVDEKTGEGTPESAIFTEIDGKIDTLVQDYYRSVWQDDGLLTEETEPDSDWYTKERIWMVDPIDGTWGYRNKTNSFGISIALIENGRPVLGVLYAPELDLFAYGVKGEGTFHNGVITTIEQNTELNSLLCSNNSYKRPSYQEHLKPLLEDHEFTFRLTESVIVKAMYILENEAQIYTTQPTTENYNSVPKLWDIAAADIIIHEAGGVLTNLKGELYKYNNPDLRCDSGVIMGTPLGHEFALQRLKI